MTTHTFTGVTPFYLAFGSEAIIRAEVGLTNHRISHHDKKRNEDGIRLQLGLLDGV